ncbi:hypothetical protein KN815_23215 [Streptomyces sp. 4503]|uniref:Uncharacterized protein n=1 Tax=Streptomyces niphimycinicus TaxID=2842201 RepID=A0ABS6CJ58_9ACTN|nr:hypothetical protein [Streptomyces niphimycinicus]MBU3866869.1 hypothetical protein [Streptomyces niphimycinicus]
MSDDGDDDRQREVVDPDLYGAVSPLGVIATETAWRDGDGGQRDLLTVLDRNRRQSARGG